MGRESTGWLGRAWPSWFRFGPELAWSSSAQVGREWTWVYLVKPSLFGFSLMLRRFGQARPSWVQFSPVFVWSSLAWVGLVWHGLGFGLVWPSWVYLAHLALHHVADTLLHGLSGFGPDQDVQGSHPGARPQELLHQNLPHEARRPCDQNALPRVVISDGGHAVRLPVTLSSLSRPAKNTCVKQGVQRE